MVTIRTYILVISHAVTVTTVVQLKAAELGKDEIALSDFKSQLKPVAPDHKRHHSAPQMDGHNPSRDIQKQISERERQLEFEKTAWKESLEVEIKKGDDDGVRYLTFYKLHGKKDPVPLVVKQLPQEEQDSYAREQQLLATLQGLDKTIIGCAKGPKHWASAHNDGIIRVSNDALGSGITGSHNRGTCVLETKFEQPIIAVALSNNHEGPLYLAALSNSAHRQNHHILKLWFYEKSAQPDEIVRVRGASAPGLVPSKSGPLAGAEPKG